MATKELIRARIKVTNEPVINPMNYDVSLMRALNWYNDQHSTKEYKSWFLTHFKKRTDFDHSLVGDFDYRIAGVLCRIQENDNVLSDEHVLRIESEFNRIRELCKLRAAVPVVVEVGESTAAPKVAPQERSDMKVSEFLAGVDGFVDEYAISGTMPNVQSLITTMGISGSMTKKIQDSISPKIAHLTEVISGSDKQLVEGWSNFSKPQLKKILSIYESLIERLQQAKVTVPRKKRESKPKPAGIIVQKLKYMKASAALNITSVTPSGIVGASEVWVLNVRTKKLQQYLASEGSAISAKGTALINWDVTKSTARTLRKMETVTPILDKGKRTFGQFMKNIKSKEFDLNGRLTDDCLILATFK